MWALGLSQDEYAREKARRAGSPMSTPPPTQRHRDPGPGNYPSGGSIDVVEQAPPETEWSPGDEAFYQQIREGAPAPTVETEAPPSSPMTAVQTPDGRIVFTNLGGEYTKTGSEDIGYETGANAWKAGALASQPDTGGATDFSVRGGRGSYIPSAPVPDVMSNDVGEFKKEMAAQPHMGAREMMLQRWAEQQAMRGAAAEPSRVEAQAGLTGVEAQLGEQRLTDMKNPVAAGERRGTASAAELGAHRAELVSRAKLELQSPERQQMMAAELAQLKPRDAQQVQLYKQIIMKKHLDQILSELRASDEKIQQEMIRSGLGIQ
jgi:hypothetical protein